MEASGDIIANQKKPVKVKDNFLLAHKGIVPGVSRLVKQNERQDIM